MVSLSAISRPSSTSSTTCCALSSSLLPARVGRRGTERREVAKDPRNRVPTSVSFLSSPTPPLTVCLSENQDASARKVAESQLELTRSKVEELRKLIAERKARRVLRREAAARAASYSTAWSLTKECDKHEGEGEGGGVQEQCQPPDFLLPSEPEPCTA